MPDPLYSRVAAEVRAEMGRQRFSGTRLARHLKVSQAFISRRLTGQVPFDVAELEAVAEVLNVPVSRFLDEVAA